MECKIVTAAEVVIDYSSHADIHFPILLRFLVGCRVSFASCSCFGFGRQRIGLLWMVLTYVSSFSTSVASVVTVVPQWSISVFLRDFLLITFVKCKSSDMNSTIILSP